MKGIRPADIHKNFSPGDYVILDVRHDWELELANLGSRALHIPMGDIQSRMHELPTDKSILVLCHHGGRSYRVAEFLKSQGFDDVVNIDGGIDAWSNEVDQSVPRY